MTQTRCPACPSGTKGPGKYLCFDCWDALSGPARRSLSRRDSKAMARIQELYAQLGTGLPLADITVTP